MKLSDPFGRMARRHEAGYNAMSLALEKSGIKTPQAAREIIILSRKRATKVLCGGCGLLLLVGCIVPKTLPLVFGMTVFLAVWVITSTMNGQRYIKRYISEELAPEQTSD